MSNEWDNEPNRKHWIDPDSGLDCLIVRNHFGALCGYVGVPAGHQWYGLHYDDVDVDVHGGLTYSERCSGKICHDHDSETIACADVHWLGFDCAHLGDFVPGMEDLVIRNAKGTYKNMAYVEVECKSLAAQVKAAERKGKINAR